MVFRQKIIHVLTSLLGTNELSALYSDVNPDFKALAPEKCVNNFSSVFQKSFCDFKSWALHMKLVLSESHRTHELVNIRSGYDLVPSGNNKPLPEPVLTLIFVAIWCH